MKYFYTDPLAAAWMAKHFGVRFCDKDNGEIFILMDKDMRFCYRWKDHWGTDRSLIFLEDKFYIHPDSAKLLEPQEGDLIEYKDGQLTWVPANGNFPFFARKSFSGDLKVIQRNGIAFMWPEVEA